MSLILKQACGICPISIHQDPYFSGMVHTTVASKDHEKFLTSKERGIQEGLGSSLLCVATNQMNIFVFT